MALTINNPTSNPFNFFFTEPLANPGPDPKNFDSRRRLCGDDSAVVDHFSASLQGLTSNFGKRRQIWQQPRNNRQLALAHFHERMEREAESSS